MKVSKVNDVNYWPGYVDALINIVLNLLFLVGVFTVGLVVLNGEAIFAEKKAAQIKAENLSKGYTDENKEKTIRALLKTVQKLGSVVDDVAPQVPQIYEIYFKAIDRPLNKDISSEKPLQVKTLEDIAQMVIKKPIYGKLIFDANQFALEGARNHQLLDGIKSSEGAQQWLLVVISDPENKRTSREAFARLVSTRNALVALGVPVGNIEIRISPPPDAISLPPDLGQTIFVTRWAI